MDTSKDERTLVVVSGGTSDPSSTRMLADRLSGGVRERAIAAGERIRIETVELRPLAAELAAAQVSGFPTGALAAAIERVGAADALIVATPVYKAGVSGLVKSFFDVVDADALIAVPTLLAATAGSARHALVVDEQLRSLFAYFRALTVPTSVFAAGEDWGSRSLTDRVDRAANELLILVAADVRARMREASWGAYSRTFGSSASGVAIDLESDLMRLATGGSAA